MSKLISAVIFQLLFVPVVFAQKSQTEPVKAETIDGHPSWIMQGNIYEVNVRQYTQEGTFKAFEKHLDRLKAMGVQTLWFMPIHPISLKDRKGTLGSYYAIADFSAVNPEFGNMEDWRQLVKAIHSRGMKVIIDWVGNHTGADHAWVVNHPDYFKRDSTGKPTYSYDWIDTRNLNYDSGELQDSMIAIMKMWVRDADIDGYRCDAAGELPDEFWAACISELKKIKNVFMLAEADKPSLHNVGFDATYGSDFFAKAKQVAKGERPLIALDSILNRNDTTFPANALRLHFTSNHDENSWNKADYETMPGAIHAPFAVLTQTLIRSIPLIYSGQEEPVLRAIQFFEKDQIEFGKFARAPFYKTLLDLRRRNEALAANASFTKVHAGNTKGIFAFVREKKGKRVLVILNLSGKEQKINIEDKSFEGTPYNVFAGTKEQVYNMEWRMEPWGYAVYDYSAETNEKTQMKTKSRNIKNVRK
jgi:alpha-amylase